MRPCCSNHLLLKAWFICGAPDSLQTRFPESANIHACHFSTPIEFSTFTLVEVFFNCFKR